MTRGRWHRVGVFPSEGRRLPQAFIGNYESDWPDCCEHTVWADDAHEAKRKARREHLLCWMRKKRKDER